MFTEIGHLALVIALCMACIQATVPLYGAARQDGALMGLSKTTAVVQFAMIAVSFAALTYAYVVSDFSVANVAANSHTDKPLLYKISGVWGNHEGSMLLWVFILSIFGLSVALTGKNLPLPLRARALAVQAMITVGFLLFILLTSNPFDRLTEIPLNGEGLNPLLQDPGLAFHPPMLYLGYVGFSMAFSFAIAALLEGKVDAAWARWVRPWTLAAWIFLTAGIALGSWWAYYELGWGGWWFWDPVENASFIPWLSGTALLHSAIVVEKRNALKSWTILLAIITFSLSLLGTFLVRSGILTSVHAFASDPERGQFVLLLLAISVGGSLLLYALKAPGLKAGGAFAAVSRESSLLANNLLMTVGAATVLLGTLYPLIADGLQLGKVSVGAPFFNAVFLPLMTPMILLMALAPFLSWKRADMGVVLKRFWLVIVMACVVFAVMYGMVADDIPTFVAAGGVAVAVWLAVGTILELVMRLRPHKAGVWRRMQGLPRSAYGMSAAHLGMAFLIIGMCGGLWAQEYVGTMQPGARHAFAGYTLRFDGVKDIQGPNYMARTGHFAVFADGAEITQLTPEQRRYTTPPMPTTEAAIHSTGWADLYIAIGEDTDNGTVVRFYFKPFVPFLWYGAGLMVCGGMLSLSDRRRRVGAPAKRTRSPAAPAATQPTA